MLVQYYLADGQEIVFQTALEYPSMDEVNQIALQYAQKRTNCLPENVFVSVRIYGAFMMNIGGYMGASIGGEGPQIAYIHTAVGPLRVRIMPWATDTKLLLVGNDDDFERYDVDKIFEEVVLKDCERE